MLMNLSTELEEARTWMMSNMKTLITNAGNVNVFECTIRVLGGLLGAFTISHDQMYLDLAEDVGTRLLPAFTSSKTAVPYSDVELASGRAKGPTR